MTFGRITNTYLNQSILNNTMTNQSKYVNLNYQYSTQKKVNTLSDAPISLLTLMNAKNDIAKIDKYVSSIGTSSAQLQNSEDSLKSVTDELDRINQVATTASSEENSADELSAVSDEITAALQSILTLANTSYNGTYIYSGANITTAAYNIDGNNITYQGTKDADGMSVNVKISDDSSIQMTENGNNIFGEYYVTPTGNTVSYGAIGHIKELLTSLNATPPDYDAIRDKLDTIQDDIDNATYYRTKVGTSLSTLDNTKLKLQSQSINSSTIKSGIEDANLIEVASQMQYQQFALQASLQASSNVLQQSLLNYLDS